MLHVRLQSCRSPWRRSAHSLANGECVEVATFPGAIAVRDSKNPAGPALLCGPAQWRILVETIKSGGRP
ncbi:MAG: DUF397 domain-containing protein [Streptosporangiaceae bacterium]